MNGKEELINSLIPLLKKEGYSKRQQTWHKENEDLVIIFNIQNSMYDREKYYINLGIIIKEIRSNEYKTYCLPACHIIERIPEMTNTGHVFTAEELINILKKWEEWYGTLRNLRIKAIENKLPYQTLGYARTFLTTL